MGTTRADCLGTRGVEYFARDFGLQRSNDQDPGQPIAIMQNLKLAQIEFWDQDRLYQEAKKCGEQGHFNAQKLYLKDLEELQRKAAERSLFTKVGIDEYRKIVREDIEEERRLYTEADSKKGSAFDDIRHRFSISPMRR